MRDGAAHILKGMQQAEILEMIVYRQTDLSVCRHPVITGRK